MAKRRYRTHSPWELAPQEAALCRRQLIRKVHRILARPNEDGLAFILSAYENIEYSDIMDYISILPDEAVSEIIARFASGIPEDG